MTEQPGFDPNATVPLEALIGAPFNLIVETWESAQPATQLDPAILHRASAILEAVGWLTGHPGLDRLRKAISTGDEHAFGALVQLDNYLGMACDRLLERCKRWRVENEWTALRQEAGLAVRLTAASGRAAQGALAWFFLANAYRAFGDNKGVIDAYRRTIEAASTVSDEHLLAVANDNLGNALADVGRFDEALDCYEEALRHERDPEGRNAIQNNRSNSLRELGELRSAAQAQRNSVAELESAGTTGSKLAVALDNAALTVTEMGEPTAALKMLERARGLFDPTALADRAANALNRSTALDALGDKNAAAQAFIEAHDLAFEHARHHIDPEHYRQGFLTALAARLPSHDKAYRLFDGGRAAMAADKFGEALQLYQQAAQQARKAGDHALALRIDANAAAVLYNAGQFDQAFTIATQVRHEAATRGLARPELMVIGTLGSLAAAGLDIHDPLGPLGNLATCATILEIHTAWWPAPVSTPRRPAWRLMILVRAPTSSPSWPRLTMPTNSPSGITVKPSIRREPCKGRSSWLTGLLDCAPCSTEAATPRKPTRSPRNSQHFSPPVFFRIAADWSHIGLWAFISLIATRGGYWPSKHRPVRSSRTYADE